MSRKIIPQFEIPGASDTFNLAIVDTVDGERLSREKQQAEADKAEAEKKQEELFK